MTDSSSPPNPYEPPTTAVVMPDAKPERAGFPWRILPCGFTLSIGLLSSLLGTIALGLTVHAVMRNGSVAGLGDPIAATVLYLGFGICWSVAGVLFWKRKPAVANTFTIVGVCVPIVMFSIKGF